MLLTQVLVVEVMCSVQTGRSEEGPPRSYFKAPLDPLEGCFLVKKSVTAPCGSDIIDIKHFKLKVQYAG